MERSRLWRVVVPVAGFAGVLALVRFASPFGLTGPGAADIAPPSPSTSRPARSSPETSAQSIIAPGSIQALQGSGGYACPLSAPVAAYGPPHGYHFFVPGHPRRPGASIAPDGCYHTAAEATAAGFTSGLPPEGWQEVGGIFLAPSWTIAVNDQRWWRAASRLGFDVPLLNLFPAPRENSGPPRCGVAFPANPSCVLRTDGASAFFLQYQSFPGPDGRPTGGQGLTVAAFRTETAPLGSTFEFLFLCGGTKPSGSTTLTFPWSYEATTFRGTFIECAEGAPPSGGQRILRWTRHGVIYALGLPRDLDASREILTRIAEQISFAH